MTTSIPSKTFILTPAQTTILNLISLGYNNYTVAAKLSLQPKTVERHIHDIYAQLEAPQGMNARAYAVNWWIKKRTDRIEIQLRREWWLNHGHSAAGLYGDDSEMQCNHSDCMTDFKREDLETLDAKVFQMRMTMASKNLEMEQASKV